MIISHKHKFIFIKTKKTAGTSIEIALSKYCGENDIITPIAEKDEMIRSKLNYRGPQNFEAHFLDYGLKDLGRLMLKNKKKMRFYNHIKASDVSRSIPKDIWDNYYKFCFERSPWDKVISWYYWIHKVEPRPSISDFIAANYPGFSNDPGGANYYCEGDKLIVNQVFRFEEIKEAMGVVANQLGLPDVPELPFAKSEFRNKSVKYSELLSPKDSEIISSAFRKEIDMFGYEY